VYGTNVLRHRIGGPGQELDKGVVVPSGSPELEALYWRHREHEESAAVGSRPPANHGVSGDNPVQDDGDSLLHLCASTRGRGSNVNRGHRAGGNVCAVVGGGSGRWGWKMREEYGLFH
jgi:hypothetical protein